MAKLLDKNNDHSYVEELLDKFLEPSSLDSKRFVDRVLRNIWERLSGENDEFLKKRLKRIHRIIERLNMSQS